MGFALPNLKADWSHLHASVPVKNVKEESEKQRQKVPSSEDTQAVPSHFDKRNVTQRVKR
jgi:hypothetical protein